MAKSVLLARTAAGLLAGAAFVGGAGCGGEGSKVRAPAASSLAWSEARLRLEQWRRGWQGRAPVENVRVRFESKTLASAWDGRGAVAHDAEGRCRMILVGPAGTTLLDVLTTAEGFWVSVPPLGRWSEGKKDAPGPPPVGFLRFWWGDPFEGKLLDAREDGGVATLFIRRSDGSLTTVRRMPSGWQFARRWRGAPEDEVRIDVKESPGTKDGFGAGAEVRYTEGPVVVTVVLEGVSFEAVDEHAFDPATVERGDGPASKAWPEPRREGAEGFR